MDIKINFKGGKVVEAEFKDIRILTDQSVKNGGEGSAPEPFAYYLASIGTCAGVYILGFCQSRQIPTEGISLTQHNTFIKPPPGKPGLVKISFDITVPPDFPEKYLDALIRVADQCAVKKSILNPPEFEIKVSKESGP